MSTTGYSTTRCDKAGCDTTIVSPKRDTFGTSSHHRWADVSWQEPPQEDKKYGDWEELDLCPNHLNEFLKWMATPPELPAGEQPLELT